MKRIVFITLLLVAGLWAGEGFGQVEVEWQHNYGSRNEPETGRRMLYNPIDNNYIILGTSGAENHDLVILNIDSLGRELHRNTIGNQCTDCEINSAFIVSADRLLCVGQDDELPFIYVSTLSGDSIRTTYLDPGRILGVDTLENKLIIAWFCYGDSSRIDSYDFDGNFDSRLPYQEPQIEYPVHELTGAFSFAGGLFVFNCFGYYESDFHEYRISRLNNDGSLTGLYHQTESPKGVIKMSDGGICVYGTRVNYETGNEIYFKKLNDEFQELWNTSFGKAQGHYCVTSEEASDGGILVLSHNRGTGEYFLSRLDNLGDSVWTARIGDDILADMLDIGNNRLLITGSDEALFGNININVALFQLQPLAVETSTTPFPAYIGLSAYPNPFNSTLNIGFSSPMNREATLKVTDALGREACLPQLIAANRSRVVWNAEGLPAGKYVIYLEAGSSRAAKAVTLLK